MYINLKEKPGVFGQNINKFPNHNYSYLEHSADLVTEVHS